MPVGAGFIPARIGENKKMTEHKKLQPEIRFAGFTDDWEQRKLGEVVEFFSGLTYSPTDVLNNGTLVLRSSNIQDSQIVTDDNVYVRPECVYSQNVEIGDIVVVVRNGSKNLIGKHALVSKQMNNTVIGAFMTGIRSNNPSFFNALLDTSKFNDEIEKNLGATINQITTGAFKSMEFLIPSYEEQTQIGNFFKQLDDTIALHQRELEKFKILKTSYLEHIFLGKVSLFTAKNTITWEQRKAEDVFISISEKNHETFPVLSATQNKGMISRNDVGIDIKYDVNSLKTYKLVRKDQFVIHLRSFQGGFAHSAIDGITSPAYTILDFKDKRIHSPLFWREIFKSDFFIKRLESVIYGIRDGRSINYDEFLKLNFNYPSFEEQTQIGNFFKQLDDTIALHQREVEKYKKIKQSYLEKMFI